QHADDHALAVVARDDREPEIDLALLTAALHAQPEAAVLRTPPLGDIAAPENLESRDDLAGALVARGLQIAEVDALEKAVDSKADLQAVSQHFEMNVAGVVVDGNRQQAPHDI